MDEHARDFVAWRSHYVAQDMFMRKPDSGLSFVLTGSMRVQGTHISHLATVIYIISLIFFMSLATISLDAIRTPPATSEGTWRDEPLPAAAVEPAL